MCRVIICPHCNEYVLIQELGCGIFRHGIMKDTFEQISSHASKEECEYLKNNDLIFGCGRPFRLIGHEVVKCSYI